jgi:GNAT superfamily N-acetyltransferase
MAAQPVHKMEVSVEYLADHPESMAILARWLFEEWGHRSPDGTIAGMTENLHQRLNRDRLPLALVAIRDGQPLGTVRLKLKEVKIRPQYEHWLSTLYVHEPYRGEGIGSLLVKAAAEAATQLGVDELYLYTRHGETEALYAKLGWVIVEKTDYRGRPAVIMKKTLIHRPCG